MTIFDNAPRSASATCITEVEALKVDIELLKNNSEYFLIYLKLCQLFGTKIAKRLRYLNDVTVESFKEKLVVGTFAINIIAMTSLYAVALQVLQKLKSFFSNSTLVTIFVLLGFCYFIFNMMMKSGYPLATFGLTLKNWKKSLFESILFTLPILGIIVLIKFYVITFNPEFSKISLFDPGAIFQGKHAFNLKTYLLALNGYIIFVPLQELIVRGGIQTALQKFLTGSQTKIRVGSIILSNVIFAGGHSHISSGFAISVFLPGIFWGWLFSRQKSLLGVSISHILIGVWAAFVVGFENIF